MRKISCIAFGLLLFCLQALAQPRIEKSPAFEEPESDGWTKLLMLKNGNTFYFHYGGSDGIEVTVFSKERKKMMTREIDGANWDSRKKNLVTIAGLYEINNEPVIFLVYSGGHQPTLYRIRLNGNNGSLIKEEEIGELPKMTYFSMLGNMQAAAGENIYVEKDPQSDCYAAIFFNPLAEELDERIKILHFDGNHKIINLAYYDSPNPNFKYLNFIGAVVDGNKRVFISTYGAENAKGDEAHVFIARLNAGDSTFFNKTLDFTEDFKSTKTVMAYNHNTNTIQMLTNTVAKKKMRHTTYASFLSYIDPETLSLKGVNVVGNEKTNAYAHTTLGIDMDYTGVPQQMVINPDNSTTVLQEEITYITTTHSSMNSHGMITGGGVSNETTYLGHIGITEMGADGAEKTGYVMMKKQLYHGHVPSLYMASRNKGIWQKLSFAKNNYTDNLFMSYDYIYTDKNHYVIFNDNPKNDEKEEDDEHRKTTSSTDNINTICYSLENGAVKKFYLFGEPNGKHNSAACYIDASTYDKDTKTYVTVVSEAKGKDYESKIAWIHFD